MNHHADVCVRVCVTLTYFARDPCVKCTEDFDWTIAIREYLAFLVFFCSARVLITKNKYILWIFFCIIFFSSENAHLIPRI